MAGQNQGPNMDQFEAYFRRADLDGDGRISGAEAVGFFQGSNLSKQVLAQVPYSFHTSNFHFIVYLYK
jgi:epidermal growth factor receptor substrate 15